MHRRRIVLFGVFVALLALVPGFLTATAQERRGRKYKAPPPTARIEVTVVRADDGRPIENAAVIFHTLKDEGNMELKSNEDGKTIIDVLPLGETARVQVIAKGFQTFGQDYPVDKKNMSIEIKMKRPGKQYSIYQQHPGDQKDQKPQEKDKQDQPKDKPQN